MVKVLVFSLWLGHMESSRPVDRNVVNAAGLSARAGFKTLIGPEGAADVESEVQMKQGGFQSV